MIAVELAKLTALLPHGTHAPTASFQKLAGQSAPVGRHDAVASSHTDPPPQSLGATGQSVAASSTALIQQQSRVRLLLEAPHVAAALVWA